MAHQPLRQMHRYVDALQVLHCATEQHLVVNEATALMPGQKRQGNAQQFFIQIR
ncbi:hypothetical protein D3C81_2174230 [compost metagenome]